ncbi:MAG: adenosylcobinamide-GDP ribazoletransferase [Nitrospiraceae bacterium]
MTDVMRPFLFAWQFLTAVPLSRSHHEPAPNELAGSMVWYPVIGLLLGGLLATADSVLVRWLSREVESALLILLLIGLTRGLHQDGLADMLDGLAGGRTAADRLTIMRDPRIGAIGATGLFLSLILRYAALVVLPESMRMPVLLCMPAVGRWAMVVGAWGAPYARAEGGLAAPFLIHLSARHAVGATLVVSGALLWAVGWRGALASIVIGAILSRMLTSFYQRLLGGITGDTLGATNEVAEITFLIATPLLAGLR